MIENQQFRVRDCPQTKYDHKGTPLRWTSARGRSAFSRSALRSGLSTNAPLNTRNIGPQVLYSLPRPSVGTSTPIIVTNELQSPQNSAAFDFWWLLFEGGFVRTALLYGAGAAPLWAPRAQVGRPKTPDGTRLDAFE